MSTVAPSASLAIGAREASALLNGMGERQVYEALRRGDLPGVKIGGKWYVKRAELFRMFGLEES